FTTGLIVAQGAPQDDTADFDGDSATDKFIVLSWADLFGNWPNTGLPVTLFTANFTTAGDFADSTDVNFSASSTHVGYVFQSTSATIDAPVFVGSDLIGIDFGGGAIPNNWNTVNSTTTDFTLTNLIDEFGNGTGINAAVNFDSSPGFYSGFTPNAGTIPTHSQSLAGLERVYTDSGNIEVTFRNLVPGREYEIFVFGGDVDANSQRVIITGDSEQTFTQTHGANELAINQNV
ncbi:MAG: hypothetical protein KDA58_17255, partial [Planctomycetaceae bacterium]|nr:hypothetical protein [Planctomycetaceae bacterium]